MSSLSQRLIRLRQAGQRTAGKTNQGSPRYTGKPGVKPQNNPSAGRLAGMIPPETGWEKLAGGVWERQILFPALLPDEFHHSFVLSGPLSSESLIFYDLETTGLSGGAGNVAFLIGLGQQKQGEFIITQLFLGDYPGEPVLLERYAELVSGNRPQVSYNGRSFDSQVLKTRFLLNRMRPLMLMQIDLLYPSRRLWKGVLPNLSLGTLESEVLGFHRNDDLPGREAPDAWFEWLNGDDERIGGVFRHNADDILSLARLLVLLEEWGGQKPEDYAFRISDASNGVLPSARGMARQWAHTNPSLERRWLEAGWSAGEHLCGRELAVRLRREGCYQQAYAVWEKLNHRGLDYPAAVEMAKYREHRLKNPGSAINVLLNLDKLPLSTRYRKELEHRRRRLERKLAAKDS